MSIEYTAKINSDSIDSMLEEALSSPEIQVLTQVLSVQGDTFTLRWKGPTPLRVDWPEDISVRAYDGTVIISFHTASRHQRATLLELIATRLSILSSNDVYFEEI